jgi:hypothetical protein
MQAKRWTCLKGKVGKPGPGGSGGEGRESRKLCRSRTVPRTSVRTKTVRTKKVPWQVGREAGNTASAVLRCWFDGLIMAPKGYLAGVFGRIIREGDKLIGQKSPTPLERHGARGLSSEHAALNFDHSTPPPARSCRGHQAYLLGNKIFADGQYCIIWNAVEGKLTS